MLKNLRGNFPKLFEAKKNGIQCKECKKSGHIQFECANILKKKKAMTAFWSEQDYEQSDKEDNGIVLTLVQKGIQISIVDTKNMLCYNNFVQNNEESHTGFNEYDLDEESLKDLYIKMYNQWLKIYSEN